MRRQHITGHYLAVALICVLMLNFSHSSSESLRCGLLTMATPVTGLTNICKAGVHALVASTTTAVSPRVRAKKKDMAKQLQRLEVENERLRSQVAGLLELAGQENQLRRQLLGGDGSDVSEMMQRSQDRLEQQLAAQLQATPARVVYRGFSSWMSSVWIDVGTHTNKKLGSTVVAKNSPVVIGNAVVGVVEHVGRYRSRVRLITDVALTPSVRAVRGNLQNQALSSHIDAALETLELREDLENPSALEALQSLKGQLKAEGQTWFCAKGELCGYNKGLWRQGRGVLRGTGFNYDFSDDKGPARDLRTGQAAEGDVVPILKRGDLLVTTGMDGVFPEGLFVARVTQIDTLREGGYYYDLEAKPVVSNLDDISLVFVLPPAAGVL